MVLAKTAGSVLRIGLALTPTSGVVRGALDPGPDSPPAVGSLIKHKGPRALVATIGRIMGLEMSEFQETPDRLSDEHLFRRCSELSATVTSGVDSANDGTLSRGPSGSLIITGADRCAPNNCHAAKC